MAGSISTVDLFCGAGGLTHGFEQAGLPVKAGYDIDPICQFSYERNTKAEFILKDVEDVSISASADSLCSSVISISAGIVGAFDILLSTVGGGAH